MKYKIILAMLFGIILTAGLTVAAYHPEATTYSGWIPEEIVVDGQGYWTYQGSYYITVNADGKSGTFSLDLAGDEYILLASGTVKKDKANRIVLNPETITLNGNPIDVSKAEFSKETYDFTFDNIEARYGNMIVS